jgi:long-chain acyl-CoA synthetase
VTHWLSVRKLPPDTSLSEVVQDPRMRADVQKAVDYAPTLTRKRNGGSPESR